MFRVCERVALTAGLMALAMPAHAQTGAAFYKDKTVNYIVATAPGGGYDTYGRLVSEYMQKYLPGSTFLVKNVPGAGHLVGTNTIDLFKNSRLEMKRWGVRHVDIDILQWGSDQQSLKILGPRAKHKKVRRMLAALNSKTRPMEVADKRL